MVFSVITCTPCIVFKSVDHKIEAGAKWYPEYSNINYMNGNNASDIHNAIEDILSNENKTFANKKELVFETLNKILKGRG